MENSTMTIKEKLAVQKAIDLFQSDDGDSSSIPTAKINILLKEIADILRLRNAKSDDLRKLDRVNTSKQIAPAIASQSTKKQVEVEDSHSSNKSIVKSSSENHVGNRRKSLPRKWGNQIVNHDHLMTKEDQQAAMEKVANNLLISVILGLKAEAMEKLKKIQSNGLDRGKSAQSTSEATIDEVPHSSNDAQHQNSNPNWDNSDYREKSQIEDTFDPEEGMTDEQKIAMKHVSTNPLLIINMIENLDFTDLLACRRVNKSWTTLTSNFLLNLNSTVVSLNYNKNENSFRKCFQTDKFNEYRRGRYLYQLPTPSLSPCYQLKILNKILSKSTSFPCTDFCFISEYNENNVRLFKKGGKYYDDLNKFFKIQGPFLNTLKLISFSNEDVEEILSVRAPFLEHLEIIDPRALHAANKTSLEKFTRMMSNTYETSSEDESDYDDVKNSYRTKLKTLNFHGDNKLFIKIARRSPSLRVIDLPKVSGLIYHLDALLIADRIRYLKKLILKDTCYLERFCRNGPVDEPRLRKLDVFVFVDNCVSEDQKLASARSIFKLFRYCMYTLESVKLSNLGHFDIDQLPVFPKLKKLQVGNGVDNEFRRCYGVDNKSYRCFPIGTNLNLLCPNLHTLDCTGFNCEEDSTWAINFPEGFYVGCFWTVTTLKIADCCTDLWFCNLYGLCPNFKKLIVKHNEGNHRLQKLLPQIFKHWTHLESLKINILNLGIKSNEEKIHGLDFVLMGVNEKYCDILSSRIALDEPLEQVNRSSPSLIDLRELKVLEFKLGSVLAHEQFIRDNWSQYFLTQITGIHIFKQMPQLAVTIQFNHNWKHRKTLKKRLEPIAPFVNFTHRLSSETRFRDMTGVERIYPII